MLSEIESYLQASQMDVVGVAPVAEWPSAYSECRPTEILKGCRRVIVFGKEVSHPVFTAEKHAYDLYAVTSDNHYHALDAAAIEVASRLTRAGYPSLPIGSEQPVIVRDGLYWGMVSLKHAAVLAGVGTLGKNTLLLNKQFGTRLRLGGVITTAELLVGKPLKKSLCAEGCRKCIELCPVQALDGKGGIDQHKCLKNCIVNPIISLGFLAKWFKRSQFVNKATEMMTKTMISGYTYSCNKCLVTCPNFKRGIPKASS